MKRYLSLFTALLIVAGSFAAKDNTILTIDSKKISADEFLRIYNKNNSLPNTNDQKTVDEYLDLFINYKLKVIEAENKGYDTVPSFLKEFEGYQKQLAQPYLENTKITDKLLEEAYNRHKKEVNASHILIRLDKNPSPEDTLTAWNKAIEARNRIVNGEKFEDVAKELSEDPSAQQNGGKLGWFNAFKMVYPFESGAYSTPKGEVSQPVRSQFGYHVIKVNDVRENRGSIKVSHIYVRLNREPDELEIESAKKKINEAYDALQKGDDWVKVVENFTEHEPTKENGGDFGWLTTGTVFPEFLDMCYKVELDSISEPFKSDYGFHIVKPVEKKSYESFDELKEQFERNIRRDTDRKAEMDKLSKKELEDKYQLKRSAQPLQSLVSVMDSSVYQGEWDAIKASAINAPIFTIGQKQYMLTSFAEYISNKQPATMNTSIESFVDIEFENFVSISLKEYQEENLKVEYPEYAHLLQEYYDGILLFNISNDEVWEKATSDTSGLENYFKGLAEKHQWKDRLDVTIYSFKDSILVDKITPIAKQKLELEYSEDTINQLVCEVPGMKCVSVLDRKVERAENAWVDSLKWEIGANLLTNSNGSFKLYFVNQILEPKEKTLEDARGLYIADYQGYLEKEWIKELRNKYMIEVNPKVMKKVKKQTAKK
ncbi:MAG: peptidylprolyl isomerase [Bacteroidales bacterium]|nr:peptidylprolyl isomerase [Bacteroidales bacterium]